jgi:hypothetical protein
MKGTEGSVHGRFSRWVYALQPGTELRSGFFNILLDLNRR